MSNGYYRDLVEKALKEELAIVNKHIPYSRPSLCELIEMNVPHYVTRDGTVSLVDPRELELIKNLMDREQMCSLHLPILIEYRPSLGEGVYVVRDRVGSAVIAKLLGLTPMGSELTIYRPQLYEVRSKLKTTTTIIFLPE